MDKIFKHDDYEKEVKCPDCGKVLRDKNSRDVGVCLPCFAIRMCDGDEDDENENED
jgi:hypothetical protein